MKKTTAAIALAGSFLVLALFATAQGSGYERGYERGSRYEYRGAYPGTYYNDGRYGYRGSRYEYRGAYGTPGVYGTPSVLSKLNLRVNGFQFTASVTDFHLPIDTALAVVHIS